MFGSCSSSAIGLSSFQSLATELGDVQRRAAVQPGDHHLGKTIEVLLALAAAGINAEARRIDAGVENARIANRLLRGPDGKASMAALVLPVVGVFADVGDVPVSYLGGNLVGKLAASKSVV